MKIARLKVSSELIIDALRLPEGTKIDSASMDPYRYGTVVFNIVHEDFDEVKNGSIIPTVDVMVKEAVQPRGEWVKPMSSSE